MIKQVGRFLFVGVITAGIDFAGFLLLFYLVHTPLWVANGTGFLMGLVTSFVLNRQWTFLTGGSGEYSRRLYHQFVMYATLALTNLVVTIWLVQMMVWFGVHEAAAKFLVMGIVSVWNFLLYRSAIFRRASL